MVGNTKAMRVFYAYSWRSGLIDFGESVPDGALTIASVRNSSNSRLKLALIIDVLARHGMGKASGQLIVPGIPEAPDGDAAVDALITFSKQVNYRLGFKREIRQVENKIHRLQEVAT